MSCLGQSFSLFITLGVTLLMTGCGEGQAQDQAERPAQQVDVVEVSAQDVLFTKTLPARAVASREAQVRPQVSGVIVKRHFEEGSVVDAGDTLYQIDDAIYQANYQSALADLNRTQASVKNAEAQLKRYKSLIKTNAVSEQSLEQIEADSSAFEAEMGIRKAAVHKAKVDLEYTKVLAPISGRIGKSNVTEGALVAAQQSNAMATITQLDPIYFDMPISNTQLRDIQSRIASGELVKVEQSATLFFENGQQYAHQGQLKFSEVQANASTDSVTLRTEFPNPEFALLPGMFARVELTQAKRENAVLVPQKAVQFNHDGSAFVFVVGPDDKVAQRLIKLDRAIGQNWLILSGLNEKEHVVVSGLQKIAPQMSVVPQLINQKKAG
ncbi:efflux RND transporter periplasmic adaptor subunit [Paraglaciecola polaris]|uniref:Acriflavine resistance protein E n=1 Tax=Paraglaciecola polaris LMG 21857 TaxID=1129793 RepID=K6ZVU7_9ALTE|nr:efflux RND transporter periplasmic adaptor subunit [Paraglaciecola polaris]GAC32913.1 acriflavine resistance protein E [Paraglaciecola polaris LMG 21857]|tara:strand:- start:3713 stop:4858 length:1146 start_codon:yes stop_codon:yes gene_type:complete